MPGPVVLYVVPGCPLCENARVSLRQLNVEVTERDVANDFGALRRMFKLTRQELVPVIEYEGRAVVRPSTGELREFLGVPL